MHLSTRGRSNSEHLPGYFEENQKELQDIRLQSDN